MRVLEKVRGATYPFANSTLPADNAGVEPRVRLDNRVCHNGTPLDAHTILDDNISSNRHVGANAAVGTELGRRVDQNIPHDALGVDIDKGLLGL